jgi:hypothetical protein
MMYSKQSLSVLKVSSNSKSVVGYWSIGFSFCLVAKGGQPKTVNQGGKPRPGKVPGQDPSTEKAAMQILDHLIFWAPTERVEK